MYTLPKSFYYLNCIQACVQKHRNSWNSSLNPFCYTCLLLKHAPKTFLFTLIHNCIKNTTLHTTDCPKETQLTFETWKTKGSQHLKIMFHFMKLGNLTTMVTAAESNNVSDEQTLTKKSLLNNTFCQNHQR